MQPYSVVITSCGRFDLLRRTLSSLLQSLDRPADAFIIVEDSGNSGVRDIVSGFATDFQILINARNLGQIASIDRAYQTVTTPLIFHCEDDWEFLRSGYLAESAQLLKSYPDVSMIGLRSRTDLNPLMQDVPTRITSGIPFYFYEPARHPEYFSYSFNPGLRRLSDYRRIGPFTPLGHEPDISYAFKKAGFRMAALEQPAVQHIGWNRHINDPHQPLRSRTFLQRLEKSVRKRFKRLKRQFS